MAGRARSDASDRSRPAYPPRALRAFLGLPVVVRADPEAARRAFGRRVVEAEGLDDAAVDGDQRAAALVRERLGAVRRMCSIALSSISVGACAAAVFTSAFMSTFAHFNDSCQHSASRAFSVCSSRLPKHPRTLGEVARAAVREHRHDDAFANARRDVERRRQRRAARHADEQAFFGRQPPRQRVRVARSRRERSSSASDSS